MRKTIAFIKTFLQKTIYYRVNTLIGIILETFSFIMLMIVWNAVFKTSTTVAGFNYQTIVIYYFLVALVRIMVDAKGGEKVIAVDVYSGQLNLFLIKPISYLKKILVEEAVNSWVNFYLSLPFFLFFFTTINFKFHLSIKLLFLPLFLFSLIFSFLISSFLDYLCALCSFWLIQVTTLFHLKQMLYRLLGGIYFPQKMLPLLVRKINFWLPFYYIFSFPVELMINNLTLNEIIARFSMQFFWVVVLYFIYKILWRKGLKTYEAWGN